MNSKTSATDEMLNETELGSFISRHKTLIIALVALVLVGTIAWGFYSSKAQEVNYEKADAIYTFKDNGLDNFIKGELKVDEAMIAYEALRKKVGSFIGMGHLAMSFSQELAKKEHFSQAITVLDQAHQKYGKTDPYLSYLMSLNLASYLEDNGEFIKAAGLLENVLNSKVKVMEDRLRVDLGRLYYHGKDTNKALLNLNYVIEKGTDNSMIALARAFKLNYGLN